MFVRSRLFVVFHRALISWTCAGCCVSTLCQSLSRVGGGELACVVSIWPEPPGYNTTPPHTHTHLPPARPSQRTGSGYRGYAHFSIMSSSACRKRKPLLQPYTRERSAGDSSLSSALHFLNEIPMPPSLSKNTGRRGGVKEQEWGEVQKRC